MQADLATLMEEIRRRAERECNEIIMKAREEAGRILKEAEEEADRLIYDEVRSKALVLWRRIVGSAELEGRGELIKAKEEIVRRISDGVRERMSMIARGEDGSVDYGEVLYRLLRDGVERIGEEEVFVIANERDREYLGGRLIQMEERISKDLGRRVRIVLGDEAMECMGGVIVTNADRTKTCCNVLDAMVSESVRRLRMRMVSLLSKELSGA